MWATVALRAIAVGAAPEWAAFDVMERPSAGGYTVGGAKMLLTATITYALLV